MPTLSELNKKKKILKSMIIEADRFLSELRKAKKNGIKKVNAGTKTYQVNTLIIKGLNVKKKANQQLKSINKSISAKKSERRR